MPSLIINIIGAGSMGHLWAAHLLKQHNHVRIFGRSSKPKQTYRLRKPNQQFNYELSISTLKDWHTADWTLVCVKAGSLKPLCKQLASLSTPPKSILLIMNGLGLIDIVNRAIPNCSVYHASTSHGATLSADELKHTGTGCTRIGDLYPPDDTSSNLSVLSLIKILDVALPQTTWNQDHGHTLWKKLLVNSVINPLTAIYNIKNGSITGDPMVKQHAIQLVRELESIIEYYLPNESWHSIWQEIITVSQLTSENRSSMLQDIDAKRKTEVEFITGHLLATAKLRHITLAGHQRIYDQVRALEHIID